MKKINIAYITKEDSRDINQWSGTSLNIYKCLKKTRFNIVRVGPLKNFYEKILKIFEIIYRFLNIKFDPDRDIYLSKILANIIKKKLNKKKIDLIIVHDCPLISFLKISIPIVIWTDLTFDLFQKSYFKNYNKFHNSSVVQGNYLEKLSLKKAKQIVYSTKYAADNAKKKYFISNEKIKIIPFGFDTTPLSKKKFFIIQKKRIRDKKKVAKFLSIGVDWNRKNMKKSILVVKELNKLKIKSTLTIIGAKPPKNFVVPEYVKIVPFLDKNNPKDYKKLNNYYLNSHYFILLSKAEAFGLVIQEACSYGLPIIANNIDGMRYVAKKEYSLLNEEKSLPNKIASKIFLLNKNSQKYKKLSDKSYYSSFKNNWNVASISLGKVIKNALSTKKN